MNDLKKCAVLTAFCAAASIISYNSVTARPIEPNKRCTKTMCGIHFVSDDCENNCYSANPEETYWTCLDREGESCLSNYDDPHYCKGTCFPGTGDCGKEYPGCEPHTNN